MQPSALKEWWLQRAQSGKIVRDSASTTLEDAQHGRLAGGEKPASRGVGMQLRARTHVALPRACNRAFARAHLPPGRPGRRVARTATCSAKSAPCHVERGHGVMKSSSKGAGSDMHSKTLQCQHACMHVLCVWCGVARWLCVPRAMPCAARANKQQWNATGCNSQQGSGGTIKQPVYCQRVSDRSGQSIKYVTQCSRHAHAPAYPQEHGDQHATSCQLTGASNHLACKQCRRLGATCQRRQRRQVNGRKMPQAPAGSALTQSRPGAKAAASTSQVR